MAAATFSSGKPMSEINTTPLIDVMLVLLIMIIITIPISTHSLEYDLPQGGKVEVDRVKNSLVVTGAGELLWNGAGVTDSELAGSLARVRAMIPEPEVQFRPDANARYERTAGVLQIVKASRVTRFGFIDNDKYGEFGRAE
jgi:biopolymer transport protein ExbD